ncbi:MAG: Fe-S cluster domain-containing protein [Bacteroidales bacterium]|nr:Fe-S cluster domain-containing protein [Bacteroidales bacterium]
MSTTIIFTVVSLSLLGLLLAVVLYFVAQKFKVEEDPRIDIVEALMPGANCGGCGQAGCRAFAEACTKAENLDNLYCPVGGNPVMQKIAGALGFEVAEKAPMVAVVRCAGSCDKRPKTNVYDGAASCAIMSALYPGDTGCKYGCLGKGDCTNACNFGAISMDPVSGLPVVDDEKCTACGACVKACPKGVIELRNKGPKSRRVFVSCINKDKGGVARKACTAACIGCGKCAKTCPFGAITVENNVAYIDFNKCKLCTKCVAECPTGAIHAVNFPPRPPKPAAAPAAPAAAPAEKAPAAAPAEKAPAAAPAEKAPAAAPAEKTQVAVPVAEKKEA